MRDRKKVYTRKRNSKHSIRGKYIEYNAISYILNSIRFYLRPTDITSTDESDSNLPCTVYIKFSQPYH